MLSVIHLPGTLQRRLETALHALLNAPAGRIDFAKPPLEPALVGADSLSWRIFKNPVSLFIGGIAAVILELAEPCVRAGVWEHSSFRRDPIGRLQRTGLATMVTVYGARSVAEPMIARVAQRHATIRGETSTGVPYVADDPRLLAWVHTTAAFSFSEAYSRYVEPLTPAQRDQLYREGVPASRLYGVLDACTSHAEVTALFDGMRGRLQPSPVLFEFLHIMRKTPAFPRALVWLQPLLVRAAIQMIPAWVRRCVGLTDECGLRVSDRWLVEAAARLSNRILVPGSPATQSCIRLGLPITYLYDRAAARSR